MSTDPTSTTAVSTDKVAGEDYRKEMDVAIEKLRRAANSLKTTKDNYVELCFAYDTSHVGDDVSKRAKDTVMQALDYQSRRLEAAADRLVEVKEGMKVSVTRFDK